MKILQKPLFLFLCLTILLLSPTSQLIASCDSQSLAQNMSCSSKALNKCEQAKVELTAPACCCKFSESPSPVIPTVTSIIVIERHSKKNEQRILNDNSFFKSDLNGKESNHSSQNFFFQPKFLSNLRIYSIISSYLI